MTSDDRLALLARVAPLFALAFVAVWVTSLDLAHAIPRDGTTLVVGRDFINFWMAGRAAWQADPARFYDLAIYQAAMAPIVGPGYPGQAMSYPPSVMLVAAPFGLLPYLPALLLWSLVGPLLFLIALRGWTSDRRILVAALLCPAAVFGLISGQFAYLAAALLLTVLRWRHARPAMAGALLGLLTIKPQLGILFPILLLAERNWRAIATAALVAGLLVAASALLWGNDVWSAYLGEGIRTQARVLSDPEILGAPFMPTLFMNLRTVGIPLAVAAAVQAVGTIAAAATVLWAFRRQWLSPEAGATLFLAASIVATGYLLSYDSLALTSAMLLAAPPGKSGRLLTFGVYFLTLLQLACGTYHLPGPALIAVAVVAYFTRQAASSMWVDQRNCPTGCTQASR